ncbi:MAG: peroxiredoxin-like family protein [Acidobacteriota bacterium]
MRPHIDTIRASGAELVIIGNGGPRFARAFLDDMQLTSPLYLDPSLASYRMLGLKRSIWLTIGPPAWGHALRAFRRGSRQKGVQGDPWQEGGVFIVLPNGQVTYSYISKEAGDHPETKDLLAALQRTVKQA